MEAGLETAVATVIRICLEVSEGEEVLVVANPATSGLGAALREETERAGAEAILAIISERESLTRLMSDDMEALRRRSDEVASILDRGTQARLTCDHGSDLRLDLQGRSAISDSGRLGQPGAFGNLPCGEGFIAPVTAEGTLVVDGTIASVGRVTSRVRLEVREGRLVEAEGEEGRELLERLEVHGPEATTVAELGIGTNARATLTGNVLEDEKILGTAHVAFGASAAIGGSVQVPVHLDVVSLRPEVTVDDLPITLEGRLLVGS